MHLLWHEWRGAGLETSQAPFKIPIEIGAPLGSQKNDAAGRVRFDKRRTSQGPVRPAPSVFQNREIQTPVSSLFFIPCSVSDEYLVFSSIYSPKGTYGQKSQSTAQNSLYFSLLLGKSSRATGYSYSSLRLRESKKISTWHRPGTVVAGSSVTLQRASGTEPTARIAKSCRIGKILATIGQPI